MDEAIPDPAPDADELPGLAGGGGALAAGGAAGRAGRAGGTVGIADFGTGLGDVAVRVDVPEVLDGAAGGVATGAAGRLMSVGVGEAAGFAVAVDAARAMGAFPAAGLTGRADGEPDAADVEPGVADAEPAAADADPGAVDVRAAAGVAPFAGGAGVRGAAPACVGCDEVDFGAGAEVFAIAGVVSVDRAVASGGFRDPVVAADVDDAVAAGAAFGVGVAGTAERVGGIGASPDPRSEASSMGDAQVPEYAASEGADAHDPDVDAVAIAPEVFVPGAEVLSAADAADVALELEAFAVVVAVSGDLGVAVLAGAGLAPWPDVTAGSAGDAGIPNPAGDFCAPAAAADVAA